MWEDFFQISSHLFVLYITSLMSLLSPQTSGVLPFIVPNMFVRRSYVFLKFQNDGREDIIVTYLVLSLGRRHFPSFCTVLSAGSTMGGPCDVEEDHGDSIQPSGWTTEEASRSWPGGG